VIAEEFRESVPSLALKVLRPAVLRVIEKDPVPALSVNA
jgi:hypothetical protein